MQTIERDEQERLERAYIRTCGILTAWLERVHPDRLVAEAMAMYPDVPLGVDEILGAAESLLFSYEDTWALDAFLADAGERLSAEQCGWVEAWRDPIIGVVEVLEVAGAVVRCRSLVDHLEYMVLRHRGDVAGLGIRPGRTFSATLLPLTAPLHVFSGALSLISNPKVARGVAARTAQDAPEAFYRNPAHVEHGLRYRALEHAQFVAHFGVPWVIGAPRDVVPRVNAFWLAHHEAPEVIALRGRLTDQERASLKSGRAVLEACAGVDEVGVLSTRLGVQMVGPLGAFIEVLTGAGEPSRERAGRARDMLDSERVEPEALRVIGDTAPGQASAVMGAAIGEPDFDWARDIAAVLRRHKPWAYEVEPRRPFLTVLTAEMQGDLEWLERHEARELEREARARAQREARDRRRSERRKQKKKR